MRIFAEIPRRGASNDSGDVESGNFQRFRWLFFGSFKDEKRMFHVPMWTVFEALQGVVKLLAAVHVSVERLPVRVMLGAVDTTTPSLSVHW